ncbi:MAG: hypothetical protein WC325_13765 [Candidatus Bathyarchaeia archaeon]|jgi:hypothetical protein
MNAKNMGKSLKATLDRWVKNIDDAAVAKIVKENAIVTGGALVSLLNGEPPNDYDIYFKTKESCEAVARYYAGWWNKEHPDKNRVEIKVGENGQVAAFISSAGVVAEDDESGIDDVTEPNQPEKADGDVEEKKKYRPRYISTNAITLSDRIQIVLRFYGSVDEIHKNYDFIHCTCSYDYSENKVNLPARALEAIINKELYYVGSKYPLCSIIRSRKFITRGWTINAGQYLKMCLQLNDLNLHNIEVLKDQLTGVDSAYFSAAIDWMEAKKKENPEFVPDNEYLFEIINRIF